MRKLYYIIFLLLLASCGSRNTDFFNGEIVDIKDNTIEKEVEFKAVELDGPNFGFFSVYDSLAIYMNPQLTSHWYQVFNLKTGEEMGQFAMKGNGHKEFTPVGPIFNYYLEGNELKTLISEMNVETLHIWNVTKSLESKSTVIDKQVKMPWRKENKGAHFKEIFIKDSNTVYAKVSSNPINDYEATLPYYQIRNLENWENLGEINVFKKGIINKHKRYLPEAFLYTNDVMKPDGTKIVQAMGKVPQLNIIDTRAQKVVGYHLNYGMNLSDLETIKTLKSYFTRVCADDAYIYAVFSGQEICETEEIPCVNKIYVFDWDGHLVRKATTKHCIGEIALDYVNNILYTTSPMDEKLYYINTEELIGDTSK